MKSPGSKPKTTQALLAIAGSVAALGSWIYLRYRRDLAAAKARVASGSKLAITPSVPIEYADVGTGPPVLVIHGAGGGFDQGLDLGRDLIDDGFRVIAPSRFGYLRTPLPRNASPSAQADAHAYLLDALQLEKVSVLAASAGAPSAMQFYLRHPDRCTALVLLVPLAYSGTEPQSAPASPSSLREFLINTAISSDVVFWILSKVARKTMFKTVLGTPPADVEKAGTEEKEQLQAFLDHIEPISWRKKGLQNEAIIARSLPRYDLQRIRIPTLVVGVENCLYNTYPGARYTAQRIPGARFIAYPTGGHLLAGRQIQAWQEIKNFLNQHQPV
jgi:2-hydroxy-6-oxonona-2,4-dienedioate hydrolase